MGAKFCLVCGKLIREGYQPLDTIRASYGLQGKHIEFEKIAWGTERICSNKIRTPSRRRLGRAWSTRWCPYLGILFIPFSIVISGAGFYVAHRRPQLGGSRLAIVCIGLTFLILGVQIFLCTCFILFPSSTLIPFK